MTCLRSRACPPPRCQRVRPRWLATLLLLLTLGVGARALAQPACDDPVNLPSPIFLTVGDTQINLMRELGARLRDSEQITLIWRATGSCTNLDTLYGDVRMSGNFSYIPAGYDPKVTPTPPVCTVPAPGVLADLANSIVFPEICPTPRPADVLDTPGPVQSFVFAVPAASAQTAITAEEAYFVFGFGRDGQIAPWLDNGLLLTRPVTKGTILSMGASIGVPAGKWQGVRVELSQDLASRLGAAPMPERALGILGSEVYDGYRTTLRALAFRAYKQARAYWPDSTPSAFDKQNVRDGHYHLWSYTHWLQRTDAQGRPRKALDPSPCIGLEDVKLDASTAYLDRRGALHFVRIGGEAGPSPTVQTVGQPLALPGAHAVALSSDGAAAYVLCRSGQADAACAHLVDHIIPHVPARQWVLSPPDSN